MFGEDWFDGVAHCPFRRHCHDLRDLVGEVHFKHVGLVGLEDIEMLRGGREKKGGEGGGGGGGEGRGRGGEGRGGEGRGGEGRGRGGEGRRRGRGGGDGETK